MISQQPPVLLIHGIDDTARIFDPMVAFLRDRGWADIHALDLFPSNGDLGLEILAEQIKRYISIHLADAETFDLIGFSMGGIVSRYYLQRLGGMSTVRRFLTLASPHNGTWTGYLRQNLGARQMRPNSNFLRDLNQSVDELNQVDFTSLWTPYDLMIVPAKSSLLPTGQMIPVPVPAHPYMLTDQRSLALVAQILGAPSSSPTTAM